MKFNITNSTDIDDDQKLRAFYEKRESQKKVSDEFKRFIFKIVKECDKQRFPHGKKGFLMNQGIVTPRIKRKSNYYS